MDSLFFYENSHKINLKWINYDEKKLKNGNANFSKGFGLSF
jgi:hypothetical protein